MLAVMRSLFLVSIFVATSASAQDLLFTRPAFERLQQLGKPIVVVVHADWCSTCHVQEAVVKQLLGTSDFADVTALRVDFDHQKDIVRGFKVQYQSTLIVFKGYKEVGRSVGDTRRQTIAGLLKKAA